MPGQLSRGVSQIPARMFTSQARAGWTRSSAFEPGWAAFSRGADSSDQSAVDWSHSCSTASCSAADRKRSAKPARIV